MCPTIEKRATMSASGAPRLPAAKPDSTFWWSALSVNRENGKVNAMPQLASLIYMLGSLGTFIYLTFFDGYAYNAWNWLIAIPINLFLGAIWPIYWALLHWIF